MLTGTPKCPGVNTCAELPAQSTPEFGSDDGKPSQVSDLRSKWSELSGGVESLKHLHQCFHPRPHVPNNLIYTYFNRQLLGIRRTTSCRIFREAVNLLALGINEREADEVQ